MSTTTAKQVKKEIKLKSGSHMPAIGFGTWDLKGKAEEPVLWALAAGYRHVDTAKIYGTEAEVGRAVKESGIPREELFITTKLWNEDQGYEPALAAIDESLKKLGMDYVDLYLIHWPFTHEMEGENKREETWKAMEEIYHSGKARSIGVSNFQKEHLEEMDLYAKIPPAVNQIEMHPFWFRKQLMEYCHDRGIAVTDYAPLSRAKKMDHPVIGNIAKKHGKNNAQIMVRWGLQHGNAVIPKSSSKEHIEDNIKVFDFELDNEDMHQLDGLDEGTSVLK